MSQCCPWAGSDDCICVNPSPHPLLQAELNCCINCGKPKESEYKWFCDACTVVKEQAYAISRSLNENFHEVVIRRDRMLREIK